MSGSYIMLRDSWIYQDLKQEAQKDLEQRYAEELRGILFIIVQARFPRVETLVRQLIENKNERELLQKLIIQVSTARLEKDVRQSIANITLEYRDG